MEGIVTLNCDYKEGDSIFIRQQVKTEDLEVIPKNLNNQFGKADFCNYRRPDFLVLTQKDREVVKIGKIMIEVKKSVKKFKTNDEGFGRGQLFRDSRWHLYQLKEGYKRYFPNVKEEDIEISYYIVTVEVQDENMIEIKGEELIREVPSPYVYPYTGIIIKKDKDVNRVIEQIRNDFLTDSKKFGDQKTLVPES